MPDDVLGWALAGCLLAALVLTLAAKRRGLLPWAGENWLPLSIVCGSYAIGILAYLITPGILARTHSTILAAAAKDPPGGVSGSDIIANLIALSALSITASLGYLCLPIDRVEIRISSFVKMQLRNKVLVDAAEYLNWHEQLDPERKQRPSCRAIKLLLEPLEGLGGWSTENRQDELAKIFRGAWARYGKYVGDHLDDKWLRVLVGGLAIGMGLGLVTLLVRYLGLSTKHFDPSEFGVIVALSLCNVGTGWLMVSLVTGLRASEREVHVQVEDHVAQLAPEIKAYQTERRDSRMDSMRVEVRSHSARETAPS